MKKKSLKLEGNLSIYDVGRLRNMLVESLQDADVLELDLMDVKECDTSGLQVLCSAKKFSDRMLKKMVISEIPESVGDAMARTGITREMMGQEGAKICQR